MTSRHVITCDRCSHELLEHEERWSLIYNKFSNPQSAHLSRVTGSRLQDLCRECADTMVVIPKTPSSFNLFEGAEGSVKPAPRPGPVALAGLTFEAEGTWSEVIDALVSRVRELHEAGVRDFVLKAKIDERREKVKIRNPGTIKGAKR